ncbi:MAG: dihydrofolate reductase, partial [Aquamicrobium sp.]|nr:dihydrofolate reductase [Aquamicrobium sp.]
MALKATIRGIAVALAGLGALAAALVPQVERLLADASPLVRGAA